MLSFVIHQPFQCPKVQSCIKNKKKTISLYLLCTATYLPPVLISNLTTLHRPLIQIFLTFLPDLFVYI